MHPRAQISGANEMSQLRFHWDFFGPDAPTTAEHFLEHLEDFCAREGISDSSFGRWRSLLGDAGQVTGTATAVVRDGVVGAGRNGLNGGERVVGQPEPGGGRGVHRGGG